MTSTDSEGSRHNTDPSNKGQHHHSASEAGRTLTIPMWDSSDPDRAPPPLPLNPGTNSPKTRASASPGIQAATASLAEKVMRENATSAYITNPMPNKSSPDKMLVKGAYHRRMQSLQPTSDTRSEFRNYLENRSPERRTQMALEDGDKSPEKSPTRSGTTSTQDSGRDSPSSLYVSNRYLMKPLLGESTPTSATMLALQNMQLPGDDPKPAQAPKSITAASPPPFDAISEQILSLTAIATNLQKEMNQLSRRSKDNATDLLSLKAATNSRDEDIRKSIRELASNINSKLLDSESVSTRSATLASIRSGYSIDNKPYDSSPSSRKSYILPRVPSPGSFTAAFEKDLCGSPAPISDGSASIALLEKVLREMATKEAQEKLLELVDEVKKRPAKDGANKDADASISKMLEEILNHVKDNPTNRALVRSSPTSSEETLSPESTRSGPIILGYDSPADVHTTGQKSIVNEDIISLLRRVKNSVAEGGGLTNEVKALVRELRGEVLGMGREIGRKLDEAAASKVDEKTNETLPHPLGADEVENIVRAGLAELKEQMYSMIQEHQQTIATSVSRGSVDPSELYSTVRSALEELPQTQRSAFDAGTDGMRKEDILEAVREAWETYKPEIELQNFGLEREEILDCLSEGLKDYQPKHEEAVTYDQVLAAVQAGMQSFVPPPVETSPGITREEIVAAVKECLESFELTIPELNITREDVFAAVSEAMAGQQSLIQHEAATKVTREDVFEAVLDAMGQRESSDQPRPGITRDDVFEAVTDAMGQRGLPNDGAGTSITRDDIYNSVVEAMAGQRALPQDETTAVVASGINRDDIFNAVMEGLAAHHAAAREMGESNATRDDIINAVNEALASHPNFINGLEPGLTREDILSAISEGLTSQSSISREIELNKDDLFEAVTSGLQEAAASSHLNVGEQVSNRLQELVQDMKDEFKQYSAANGKDTEQVLDAIKDGLQGLRGEIESYVDKAADVTGKEEIIATVKEGFRLLQADLERTINEAAVGSSPRGNPDTPELLDAMEKEFEHLRSTLSNLLIRNEVSSDKDEILDAIHEITASKSQEPQAINVIQAVKEEFENIRETIGMSVVKSGPTDKDEIIAALRESFENLQSETGQKRDGNESVLSNTSELLEAFNDGIDTIRADLERLLDKSDEQSSTQILDALQEGLTSIKGEMEALRESQKEFEETSTVRGREIMLANESSIGSDIESLKILITQLQIKVEAIESNSASASPPEDALKKEHLDEVLSAVREIHGSVAEVSSREIPVNPEAARKTDTDAIEALIRDTAARIESMDLSSTQDLAKSEQMLALEALVSELKDAVAEVSTRLETEGPTKSEVGTLETLLKELWVAVDELKNQTKSSDEDPEPLAKSDLQTVEAMIYDVKTSIEELKLPDVETLPTKSEIEELAGLVSSFKEKVDSEAELTAQAFEARKVEHGGLAEKIEEAKIVVAELREELKDKLEGSHENLSELKTLLEGLAVASEAFTTVDSIKEINELITKEFERARTEQESAKLETEERDATALIKQDETRAAVVADIGNKMDEKVGEILAKYDELQATLDTKFSESESRDLANAEHMTNTKSVAEDIKLVIGAMGNSVTEACERMSDDAKTFFTKVHESCSQIEAMHNEIKEQSESSRAELEKTSAATDRVETQILEYHPQILSSIKDILEIVSQHYDHSQKTNEELKANLSTLPSTIPTLLPALPPPEPREIIVPEKYDDKELHSKLDLIMGHTENASKTMASIDKLDEIYEKVMGTSREITEMVATQSRLVVEDYERKKREAEEASYALEKRLAQKEKVETEILSLTDEKDSLLNMIQALKREKEELSQQNMKMSNELSGLTTALELRQREMEIFEERAQGLEKRILAGVFDHARTMILKETGRNRNGMSLKRVSSYASTATKTSRASTTSTTRESRGLVSNGVEMALKRRNVAKTPSHNGSVVSSNVGKERRILSLSHVTGNRGYVDRQVTTPSVTGGLTNLKRSHSVRSNMPSRKTSWTTKDMGSNKENETFAEEEEEQHSGAESDTGTERRTSYTGTYTDSMSYGTGSTVSANRRPSFASSINGLVAEHAGSILEEDDEDEERNEDSESESEHSKHDENLHEQDGPDDDEDYQTTIDEQEHVNVGDLGAEDLSELEPPPGFKHPSQTDSGIGSDIHNTLSVA